MSLFRSRHHRRVNMLEFGGSVQKCMGFSLEVVAAVVSALLTALGGAASSGLFENLKKLIEKLMKREPALAEGVGGDSTLGEELVLAGAPAVVGSLLYAGVSRFKLAKQQVFVRIRDARLARQKQQSLARWSRWSANFLTFGQYVIGGVMATSFVQKALSPEIVGIFGVLVVVASLFETALSSRRQRAEHGPKSGPIGRPHSPEWGSPRRHRDDHGTRSGRSGLGS